jgi:hypothetical protein
MDLSDIFDASESDSLEYIIIKQQRIRLQAQIESRNRYFYQFPCKIRCIGGWGDYPPHDDYDEHRINFKWSPAHNNYYYCGNY